jgi:hypothetical protein
MTTRPPSDANAALSRSPSTSRVEENDPPRAPASTSSNSGNGISVPGSRRTVVSGPLTAGHSGARGHFPNEQAAVKCLYLTVRSLDPTGRCRTRWKAALNAFATTFQDRIDN